jgi:TatD DNase family protein
MPVIIHSRDAAADTFDVIKEAVRQAKSKNKNLSGVIHCFSYGVEMAREYVKLGFYLGIGGVVTFKNAKKLKEVVEEIPLEWLVLETDCPYLSPEPNRGKRNDSSNLTYVAQQIADIKKVPYDEVVKVTSLNARKLYRLK